MLNRKNISIACFIIFSLFLVCSVSADLYIKPAKLGAYRLEVYPFFPATLEKNFEVKNLYNYTIEISLRPTENLTDIIEISEANFTLQPNESKIIDYTVSVKESGVYSGGIIIAANALGRFSNIAYQNEITLVVTKHNVMPEIFLGITVLAIAVPIIYLAYKKKVFKKIKPNKRYLTLTLMIIFSLIFISSVQAANVAMVVKSSTSLSDLHEKKIYNTLQQMMHTITLVDQYNQVDYHNYDLIVVAGRPSSDAALDNFVAYLPVNEIPTIAIDYHYIDDWGWVKPGGRSTLVSSQPQNVYIAEEHPLTEGFSLDEKVFVHVIQGKTTLDLVKEYTNLTFAATANKIGNQGTIAYGLPNTQLTDGKSVGSHSAVVFFGVTYTQYWTDEAVQLFKNAVDWLLNLDFNPPTTPVLTAPASSRTTSVKWQWTASNHISGVKNYQFQVSESTNFTTTLVNTNTPYLTYTVNGLTDGKTYYARVRAMNYLGVYSDWSNTVKTVVDLSDIFIQVNSPTPNTTVNVGDSIFVNATVQATRNISYCSALIGNYSVNLTYDKNKGICLGNIVVPSSPTGWTNLTVSATNSVGGTNSTNVRINVQSSSVQLVQAPSGGGGAYSAFPILILEASDVQLYEDTMSSFTVKARNGGNTVLHGVKISISGLNFDYSIEPSSLIDLDVVTSQEYTITLKIPDKSVSEQEITIKALSFEMTRTKKINLTVLQKILVPVLQPVSIELPIFVEGEESSVNITIENIGNLTTTATASILLPEGWTSVASSEVSEINPEEQSKFLFFVTPSNNSGSIDFDVSYLSNSEEKKFSQGTNVTVNPRLTITGMIVSALSAPEVYVPASAAVILILIFLFRKKIPTPKGLSRFFGYKQNPVTAPRRRINPASSYLRWERRRLNK